MVAVSCVGTVAGVLAQSQVSLGDGFKIFSVYSALLGSNMDTSFVSVYGVFHILFVNWCIMVPEVDSRPALCLCILRCAWFDSGYMRCVSLRTISYFVNWWIMDPEVDSRPALCQRLLGPTVDTSLCVSLRGWSSWSLRTSRCIPSLSSGT